MSPVNSAAPSRHALFLIVMPPRVISASHSGQFMTSFLVGYHQRRRVNIPKYSTRLTVRGKLGILVNHSRARSPALQLAPLEPRGTFAGINPSSSRRHCATLPSARIRTERGGRRRNG